MRDDVHPCNGDHPAPECSDESCYRRNPLYAETHEAQIEQVDARYEAIVTKLRAQVPGFIAVEKVVQLLESFGRYMREIRALVKQWPDAGDIASAAKAYSETPAIDERFASMRPEPVCNGQLVHDEYTLCPLHNQQEPLTQSERHELAAMGCAIIEPPVPLAPPAKRDTSGFTTFEYKGPPLELHTPTEAPCDGMTGTEWAFRHEAEKYASANGLTPPAHVTTHEHAGIPSRRPFKPDAIRVERGDWVRASGMCICDVCGVSYFDHATVRGYDWLQRLCDGRLVKL